MSDSIDIRTYISDLIALEHHILLPVEKQLDEEKVQYLASANAALVQIRSVLKSHITTMEQHLEAIGGHPASELKSGVGNVLGSLAASVQEFRRTKLSQGLRDDYTALSLAAVSYEMLYTTAVATNSQETEAISLRHLKDITPIIMDLTKVIADVVNAELCEIDPSVNKTASSIAINNILHAWSRESPVAV